MASSGDKRVAVIQCAPGTPSVTLICMPYAGGNPELFSAWAGRIARDVELVAVRLPGHGSRIRETPFADWDDLVSDTCDALAGYLSGPHVLYGHCFGARLAYEVAHRTARGSIVARRLFLSGCRSPDAPQGHPYLHELPDDEFCDALAKEGAAPPEVLGSAALMRMLLPAVRGEIRLAELWDDRHGRGVSVPITAIRGREDAGLEAQRMAGWPAYTTGGCEFAEVPGDHFFLHGESVSLLNLINSRLASLACKS
jgi:medium-chain acyl-[acyl-carrier-protein] hydrolase